MAATATKPSPDKVIQSDEHLSSGPKTNINVISKKIKSQRESKKRDSERKGAVVIFQATDKDLYSYALKASGIVNIPDDWKDDPETKEYLLRAFGGDESKIVTGMQTIRYARGINSIFEANQTEAELKRKDELIIMEPGERGVPCHIRVNAKKEPTLYAYLMLHSRNSGNPVRMDGKTTYTELRPADAVKKNVEKSRAEFAAIQWIMSKPEVDLFNVAAVFGVALDSEDDIRDGLMAVAKSTPDRFMQIVNDPLLSIKSTYMIALQIRILTLENNIVRWAQNNAVIQVIPSGMGDNHIEIMAKYFNSEEGEKTYDALVRILST